MPYCGIPGIFDPHALWWLFERKGWGWLFPLGQTPLLLLISSDFEGYPAVAIEALAARRPIVTTSCSPAIDEIMLHLSFGRGVDAAPAIMAEAIMAMLDTPPPDETALAQLVDRHRLGSASAQYLELFDRVVRPCSADLANGHSRPRPKESHVHLPACSAYSAGTQLSTFARLDEIVNRKL